MTLSQQKVASYSWCALEYLSSVPVNGENLLPPKDALEDLTFKMTDE